MTNLDVLKLWHTSVWQNGDVGAIADIMRDDPNVPVLFPDLRLSPEDTETFAEVFLSRVSNLRGDFVMSIENGEWVAALVEIHGTVVETGKEMNVTSTMFARVVDGKITEIYSHFDQFKMFEAMGALPDDAFAMCLMGETLS